MAKTWQSIVDALPSMNEKQLRRALAKEVSGPKRKDVIVRLHRRFTKIRQQRELTEYLALDQGATQ